MKELVSVIVPVYNVEKYLERSIDSILAQSYENIEVILVNDGSTDNSRLILSKYEMVYSSKLVVYDKSNGGLSSARNFGLDKANGEYILFVDSDDTIDRNMIANMMKMIKKYNCDIAFCGRFDEYSDKQVKNYTFDKSIIFSNKEVIKNMLIRNNMDFAAWDKLYKKELWENIRFPDGINHEDMYTIPYIINKAKRIVHVGIPYYHYYHRTGSITTTVDEKRIKDYYSAIQRISDVVKSNYKEIKDEYIYFMNNSYLTLLLLINKLDIKNTKKENIEIENIETEAKNYLKKKWNNKFSLNLMNKKKRILYFLIRYSLYKKVTSLKKILDK